MKQNNMLAFNRLAVIVGAVLLAIAGEARTKKGDKLLVQGRAAEVKQDFEKALELLEKAWAEDPGDAAYQMALRRVRFQASTKRVDDGQKLREEGKLEEALVEFQKAYSIDPGSTIAVQEIRRTRSMIERERRRGKEATPEERSLTPQQQARKEVEDRAASLLPVPELKPISRQITSLRMTNQPVRVLFETLGKLAGINVIMDTEYTATGRNYSVDLTNTTIEDALEHLSILTKSYWKALSPNTIFVTNENVTKRRDYEDWVAKVFYMTNTTAPQELNEISTAVRAVTNLRQVFVYAAQNAIIVRGTVDQVALAEKLFLDLDKPKSEVVVDVIVMEANRTRTRDLAATITSGGTSGFRVPITFDPRSSLKVQSGGEDAAGGILLDSVGKINTQDFSLTLPSGLLQALMSDRGTRVLQSPQLRAADGVKSSLKIGDRFPYAVGSFQPGIGGAGLNPLVSTQFQFADVGVNVDITPKIHGTEEVSMQVDIDISNVRDSIDVGGLKQPIIGQRKLSHAVRLREGEVSLLGGLLQDQDTKTMSGIPGLAQIPFLRRLFSSENVERNQSELLIAIVPHILRGQELSDVNLRSVASGVDQTVKLSYSPRKDAPPELPAPPKPAATASPPDAPKPDAPKPDAPKPAEPRPAEEPKPPEPKPEPGSTRLFFAPVAVETSLSATVNIAIQVDAATDLFSAPLKIKFDPKFLRMNEALRGTMFSADGQQPIFTRNIRNDTGEAIITHSRLPGSPGLSGAGTLVTLVFQTVGRGSTTIQVLEMNLSNSKMQPITVAPPPLAVEIR